MKKNCCKILLLLYLFLWIITAKAADPQALSDISITSTVLDEETVSKLSDTAAMTEVRALIKPLREAVLSTELFSKIKKINFKNGDYFKQGDHLVQFECDRQSAELRASQAEVEAKRMIYQNNEDLSQFDAVSSLELKVSKAQLDKAQAELRASRARNRECQIIAPWDGRVTDVNAHAFEVVEPGREIMKILDDRSLEVEMIVPSNWLRWLKPGISSHITIDETGEEHVIEVSRVGARVDPVSQTIRIFASFKEETSEILAGMSGTVFFSLPADRNI
ncbi:MAG: efflux RND transporter periplasmic adaptor subunit [Nitrosomonas sp.]|nr:efflux RND transporter periplasmic adaptor subunit [Nitrosomonas sp.]